MKELGGVHVIGQKADAGAGERGQNYGHVALGHHQRHHQHGHAAYDGYAAGQTVQAVDKVDGVGAAHYPEYGDRDRQIAHEEHLIAR
jgi:hypothetical protein